MLRQINVIFCFQCVFLDNCHGIETVTVNWVFLSFLGRDVASPYMLGPSLTRLPMWAVRLPP